MTRNWNRVRARLTDPFDPDNEEVDQQIQAMIAKQDAQGAGDGSHLVERPVPTRGKPTATTSSTRKVADALEVSPSKPRKRAKLQDKSDSLASRLDNALTASKRAAFGRRKDGTRQRDTQNPYTDTNVSKLDQPLRGSKRKADGADHEEERGREAKRRIGPGGRPTAPPFEDSWDY
ncbi:hypothetical protein INS49_003227 [Diaporthe citri]|uniref:uncharacterized protein n=1 Tax=Diaporthe citri TaxID=83186 RepID=UPI001C7F0973|nr:uncharacterized protein INS49_003227 [Diaporthe citri]KAG6369008.1 hypothetical protein INS49_003227 [Diaporthe citri]